MFVVPIHILVILDIIHHHLPSLLHISFQLQFPNMPFSIIIARKSQDRAYFPPNQLVRLLFAFAASFSTVASNLFTLSMASLPASLR